MAQKNIAKIMLFLAVIIGIAAANGVAVSEYFSEHGEGHGYWVTVGGRNSYKGIDYNGSREQTMKLKSIMDAETDYYRLVPYDEKSGISKEDWERLSQAGLPFSNYIGMEMAGNRKYKGEFYVYAFKLSIDDLLKTYHDENELLETYTEEELGASTVIIDILYWDKADKTGKAVTDYGDNLPDYEDTGYINIKTPIGAHIKLHNVDDNNWYEIDLTAGDNVIKLKIGTYYIDYINDKDMAERENSIVANNRIQIEPDNTIENAYSVSLDLAMQKYGIYTAPTKDAGNDRATKEIAEKGSGKTERTQVKADEEVKEKQKQNRLWVYVILVVIAIALFIAYKILKRKGGGKPL